LYKINYIKQIYISDRQNFEFIDIIRERGTKYTMFCKKVTEMNVFLVRVFRFD